MRSLSGLYLTSFDPSSIKVCNKSLEEANRLRSSFRKDLPLYEAVKQKRAPVKRTLLDGSSELEPPAKKTVHKSISKKRTMSASDGACGDSKKKKSDRAPSTGSRSASGDCEITAVERPTAPRTEWRDYRYYPVDVDWQRQKCTQLGLSFVGPFRRQDGGSDVILTRPDLRSLKRISGDGNCLFRAMSYVITG